MNKKTKKTFTEDRTLKMKRTTHKKQAFKSLKKLISGFLPTSKNQHNNKNNDIKKTDTMNGNIDDNDCKHDAIDMRVTSKMNNDIDNENIIENINDDETLENEDKEIDENDSPDDSSASENKQNCSNKKSQSSSKQSDPFIQFFYTNDKFINNFEDENIINDIKSKYPLFMNPNASDFEVKKTISMIIQDKPFVESLLEFYNINVFEFFKFIFRLEMSIFRGPFLIKVARLVKEAGYVHE